MPVFLYAAFGSNRSLNGASILCLTKGFQTFQQIRRVFMQAMAGSEGATGSAPVQSLLTCASIDPSKKREFSHVALASNPTRNGEGILSPKKNPLTFPH